jgi:hypothetical protein
MDFSAKEIREIEQMDRWASITDCLMVAFALIILFNAISHYRHAVIAGHNCGLDGFGTVFRYPFQKIDASKTYSGLQLIVYDQSASGLLNLSLVFLYSVAYMSFVKFRRILLKCWSLIRLDHKDKRNC